MIPKLLNDTLGERHTEVFKGSTKLKNFERLKVAHKNLVIRLKIGRQWIRQK